MHIKGFKSPENKALPFVAEGLSVDRPVRFVMKVHTDILSNVWYVQPLSASI